VSWTPILLSPSNSDVTERDSVIAGSALATGSRTQCYSRPIGVELLFIRLSCDGNGRYIHLRIMLPIHHCNSCQIGHSLN
jgi:hypothetical protein